jgi:uncharacterized protein YaiE (UPF0345 family)
MEIQQGALQVQLPDSKQWQSMRGGESFEVPANSAFTVKVTETTDYCCSFIK